jgi:hypothetical protein
MIIKIKWLLGLSLLGSLITGVVYAESEQLDPETKMVIDENWELVKGYCTGCHSAMKFIQQKLTRDRWQELLVWMQKEQGLKGLSAEDEVKILDYLALHYTTDEEKRKQLVKQHQIDKETGLIVADNWKLVRGNCTGCHSARKFSQQRLSRARWQELIRWMQKNQGLWQFDSDTENKILDYLATYYSPQN